MLFPDGSPGGPLRLRGAARDLYTDATGSPTVDAEATVHADLDGSHVLRSLFTEPAEPPTERLLGLLVGTGFRGVLEDLLGTDRQTRHPLYQLLDDLPVAALISGYARMFSLDRPDASSPARMLKADICSGWRSDGTMMVALRSGRPIPVTMGPPAPGLVAGDPLGWHHLADLPVGGMRRRRLVDVSWGDPLTVHAMFRDTYRGADGVETVLHEYTHDAIVDPHTERVLHSRATPRSLPWVECPEAAASAVRCEGHALGELRRLVPREFRGTSTCTHLNDLLRSVAAAERLTAILRERTGQQASPPSP
jgi:hypothetical protein